MIVPILIRQIKVSGLSSLPVMQPMAVPSPRKCRGQDHERRLKNVYQVSLKAARVNVGMSQTEAGKKIGVSKQTVANWESGKTFPDYSALKTICKIYAVPMDNLFIPS